jgi:hypothetical protein
MQRNETVEIAIGRVLDLIDMGAQLQSQAAEVLQDLIAINGSPLPSDQVPTVNGNGAKPVHPVKAASQQRRERILDLYGESTLTAEEMRAKLHLGKSQIYKAIYGGRIAHDPRVTEGDRRRAEAAKSDPRKAPPRVRELHTRPNPNIDGVEKVEASTQIDLENTMKVCQLKDGWLHGRKGKLKLLPEYVPLFELLADGHHASVAAIRRVGNFTSEYGANLALSRLEPKLCECGIRIEKFGAGLVRLVAL